MNKIVGTLVFLLILCLNGCGWVQSLRREVAEDQTLPRRKIANIQDFDYTQIQRNNKFLPPAPINLDDKRLSQLSGTPLDYSGTRAKRIRVTAADFFSDNSKNENSLWAEDGQQNYLFSRNKHKVPGDLITVQIEEALRRDMINSVRRVLPPEFRDSDITVPGLTKEKDAAARAVAGVDPTAQEAASGLASEDLLTAEVVERFPNGNLRIRGIKRIPFKYQVRNVEVVAIVKSLDINEQDLVKSSRFFDQRVEMYK